MLPIQKKISSYNYSSRQGNAILYIVLHYTGNKGDTAKNNVDYFLVLSVIFAFTIFK